MITEDELLKALRDAQAASTDGAGLTVREIISQTRWGKDRVRAKLMFLKDQGLLIVGEKTVESIDGRPRIAPCYSVKK